MGKSGLSSQPTLFPRSTVCAGYYYQTTHSIDNYRLQALIQKALADADVRLVIWVVYVYGCWGEERSVRWIV